MSQAVTFPMGPVAFSSTGAEFEPEVGGTLLIDLPGERMLCAVVALADHDRVIVEISGVPMAKSHQYQKGQQVPVERKMTQLGEVWEAMDERLLQQRANAEREAKKAPTPVKAKKRR